MDTEILREVDSGPAKIEKTALKTPKPVATPLNTSFNSSDISKRVKSEEDSKRLQSTP